MLLLNYVLFLKKKFERNCLTPLVRFNLKKTLFNRINAMSALLDDNTIQLTDRQHRAVVQLKDLIKEHPSINFQQYINFLTKYLRISDWNHQEAIKKIINVYKLKKGHPEWFAKKRVSEYLPIIKKHTRYMLPDRDKNGRRIFVYKLDTFYLPELNLKFSSQLDDMWFEAILMDQATQHNGISVIADCKNMAKVMIKWLIPKDLKVSAEKTNNFPCKNFTVHLVNVSGLINIISKAFIPFLNENAKSMFHFHKKDEWTSLHDIVGKDCLPEEYGGPSGKRVEPESAYQFLLDKEEIIFGNVKYGLNIESQ